MCKHLDIHDRIFYCDHGDNDNVGMCMYPWSVPHKPEEECSLLKHGGEEYTCKCGDMVSHKDADTCMSCAIDRAEYMEER